MIREQWQQHLQDAPPAPAATAGLAWLPELAAVCWSGRDARAFLQGYLTCDTADLTADQLRLTALCDLKGRVVVNGWCALAGGGQDVLLFLHASLVETLTAFLAPYLRFARGTSFTDLGDRVLVFGSLDLPDVDAGLSLDPRRRLLPVDRLDDATALTRRLPAISADHWLGSLADDGVPLVSAPVSGTFLPQMLALDRLGAVDFAKGCYLGQEVVARAQHRGEVKRQLSRLRWQGGAAPAPGADIVDEAGRVQGTVVQSVAAGPATGTLLAVLRRSSGANLRQGDSHLTRLG